MDLETRYALARDTPSDINEHVPKLRELAAQCQHVIEFGLRTGVSTVALLAGQPKRLISYDIADCGAVAATLKEVQGSCEFEFRQQSSLEADIEETDFLFIDTRHTANQLVKELVKHAGKVRKWIAMHDTTTCGEIGDDGEPGLLPALRWFLLVSMGWSVLYHVENNNGLTVISRL